MHMESSLKIPTKTSEEIKFIVGADAVKLLNDPLFRANWRALHAVCPWATVFQSIEFLSTWFQIYGSIYIPILIIEERDNVFVGGLALSRRIKKGNFNVAGVREAEYQTWIAEETNGEAFIKKALSKFREVFPGKEINFYNIPPEAPIAWAEKDTEWKQICELRFFERPLMDLMHPNASKLFTKQQFREKRNRLKRLGELKLEHIVDPERFADVLDELADHFDFRKGATYNHTYFRLSPLHKQFMLAMFNQNLLQATVLKLNEEVIASIVAQIGNKRIHLGGINTHSPFYSMHSPGYVHFLMVGQKLLEEGFELFDLTPGRDPYKRRLATTYDQVCSLRVSNRSKIFAKKHIISPIVKMVKKTITKQGGDVRNIRIELQKIINRWRKTPYQVLQQALRSVNPYASSSGKSKLFVTYRCSESKNFTHKIEKNSLSDLLDFDPKNSKITRWDFLADAMRNLELGNRCYTYSDAGILICCVWVMKEDVSTLDGKVEMGDNSEAISVLQNFFYHPQAIGDLSNMIDSIAEKLFSENEAGNMIFARINSSDNTLIRTLNTSNFRAV